MYGESPATSPPPQQQQSPEDAPNQSNQFDYYISGLPSWKQKLILAKLQRDAATADEGNDLPGLAAVDDDDDLHTGASADRSEGARLMSPADPVSRAAEHVGAEAEKNGLPNNRVAAELGLPRVSVKSRATASPPPASPLGPSGAAATAASRHWPVPGSDRRQLSRTGSRPTWYRPTDEIVVVENAATAGSRCVGWPPSENGSAFAALLPAGSSSDGCQPQPRIGIVHQVVNLIEQQQHQQQQLQLMEAAAVPKPPPRRKPRQLADGPSADGLASASSPPLSPGVPEPSFIVATAASATARPAPLQMTAASRLGPAPFRTPRYEGGSVGAEPAAVGINGAFAASFVVPSAAAPPLPPRRAVDARISAARPAAVPPPALPQLQHRPALNSNAEVHRVRHVEASSDLEQKPWTTGVSRVVVGGGAASRPAVASAAEALAAPVAAGKPHLITAQAAHYPPGQSSLGGATAAVSIAVNGPVVAATRPPQQQQQQRVLSAGAAAGAASRGSGHEERVPEPRPATAGGKALGGVTAANDETYSVVAQRSQVHAASSIGTAAGLSVTGPPVTTSNAARTTGTATSAISANAVAGAAVAASSTQRQADVRPAAAASGAATAGLYVPAATPAAASAAIVKRDAAATAAVVATGTAAACSQSAPERSSAVTTARLTSAAAASAGTASATATAAVSSVASSAAGAPAAGPAAAAAAAAVSQQQQQAPRAAVSTVKLPSVGAATSQSAAGSSPTTSPAAASAAQNRSNVATSAVSSAAASPQPSANTTYASAKSTTTVVSLKSATTTSSSTDPPAAAVATRAAGGASGSSASASAPGIRTQPDSRTVASAAAPSAGGSDKPGEALEFLQALSRRKAAAAAAAAAAAEESDRHPEMGTGRRVFDTRSAMSKERKVPEYEKIFEGKAAVFYNDNVVVGGGNLRKSTGTAKNVKFNSSLLSRMFEYPSEDSLLSSLPKETGSVYYDDAAGTPSTSAVASAGSNSGGDEEEEPPLPTRFGALTLDPSVILEGRPRGGSSSSHSPHQPQPPPAASSADTSGGTLVGLSGSVNESSNTDC